MQFYAVAVFASFLGALTAAARLAWRDGRRAAFAVDAVGFGLSAYVLVLNLERIDGLIALGAAALARAVASLGRARPSCGRRLRRALIVAPSRPPDGLDCAT